jgi:hypothetical protein
MHHEARRRAGRGRRGLDARVEPLEGRALQSYLVIARDHRIVPVHVSDARSDEPLFSNGLAAKKAPNFYNLYTGPRRPELSGVRATAYVSKRHLILSGTVAGPIPKKPQDAAQESVYTFGIDRGGASRHGPFPGREHIRFDSVVVAAIRTKGISAYVQLNDPRTNQPLTPIKSLPSSSVSIVGDRITIGVPLKMLPSSGHALDQWNVNFFTRDPSMRPDFHSVASFTPEFTEFQVHVKPGGY